MRLKRLWGALKTWNLTRGMRRRRLQKLRFKVRLLRIRVAELESMLQYRDEQIETYRDVLGSVQNAANASTAESMFYRDALTRKKQGV